MPIASSCPTTSLFERLRLGQFSAEEIEQFAQHVEQCPPCAAAVEALANDTLVEALKAKSTKLDRPEGEVVSKLAARLKQLRPVVESSESTAAFALPSPVVPVEEGTQEIYDFLAPPRGPGEIGWLGPYRVLKILGVGGMGVVFQAEDPALIRMVALKAMKRAIAANSDARKRFLREAQTAAAVKNDHVVTIYQVGEDRGVPYLAMEYLEGEPLDGWLKRGRQPNLAQLLRMGREMALGLEAAHARGLIHRDIKPGNIWLEMPKGRIKLLDFGLARGGGSDVQVTQSGAIVGTPAYMAPEQARGEKVDPRADLFSLGCVLYRLATGAMPFKGSDTMSVLMSLAMDTPRSPREINAQLPPALNELIEKLLSKDPAGRPASAKVVVQMLQNIEREAKTVAKAPHAPIAVAISSASASSERTISSASIPQPQPTKRRRRLISATLVALALFGLTAMMATIIIRIRSKDGRETTVEVPEGSKVTIEKGGKVLAEISDAGAEDNENEILKDAPKNSLVLFDGKDLSGWINPDGKPATWRVEEGYMQVTGSNILTKEKFGSDFRLHLEFWLPLMEMARGMDRANSGVYLQGRYEIQILDSFMNETNADGSVGAMYGILSPDKEAQQKAIKPPEQWNTFDITFHAPRVDNSGKATVKGRLTVVLNGIKILENGRFDQVSLGALDDRLGKSGPLVLQYHGSKVRYRNIWLLPLPPDAKGSNPNPKLDPQEGVGNSPEEPAAPVLPSQDAWLKKVAALYPLKQVEAVAARLKERNPGFDGKVELEKIEDGKIAEIWFLAANVTDISPVRALVGLKSFNCANSKVSDLSPLRGMKLSHLDCSLTQVSDLSPLKGMPLTDLACGDNGVSDLSPLKGMPLTKLIFKRTPVINLSPLKGMNLLILSIEGTKLSDLSPLRGMKLRNLNCSRTQVSDLSPLKGMPLTVLDCHWTQVSDLSPLKDMLLTDLSCVGSRVLDLTLTPLKNVPLISLGCDFMAERDAEILRSIKTLKNINGKPAADFWKEVDAKTTNKKP